MLIKKIKLQLFKNKNNKKYYVNGKDLCTFIGVKQPFAFTSYLKDFDEDAVISGIKTEDFRPQAESSRTVYYEVGSLLKYLKALRTKKRKFSFDSKYLDMVIREFEQTEGL